MDHSKVKMSTCSAPMNMAVIKYWGKRDEDLLLPLNSSLSATLCPGVMCATTTVCTGPALTKDRFWLNGKEQDTSAHRLDGCLAAVRKAASRRGVPEEVVLAPVHVCSVNNFPTAAGLASSAAGYAALVASLWKLYGLQSDSELSAVARRGSGSACRSTEGGWVLWNRGEAADGTDSVAEQIAPEGHWPEMRVLILVVNDTKKKISSTKGMRVSAETSELLEYRARVCVPKRIEAIRTAILKKDFQTFAEITMKDSNQFHATCVDTYPPFLYLDETSFAIIDAVHAYNAARGKNAIAYTFDAGPNACLFMLEDEVPFALSLVERVFPSGRLGDKDYFRGMPAKSAPLPTDVAEKLPPKSTEESKLRYLILTKVGSGPTEMKEHLLDGNGNPKNLS